MAWTRGSARPAPSPVRPSPGQDRGFADIDAEIYDLVDGDDSDDAAAPKMVGRLREDHLDMVTGRRVSAGERGAVPGAAVPLSPT